MKLTGPIHFTHIDLLPEVPLYVYAAKGERYSILIDTGIQAIRENVLALCNEVAPVKFVLLTHAHADHIGCNRAVQDTTGAIFAAAGALPWIEDLEVHYREFCLPSEHLPDSPEQRAEIMGLMDGPVPVDIVLAENTRFRLGGDVELTTISLPGHKLEEVAFLERSTKSLIMGDVLLALAAPFFHGFQTAHGFRSSLDRLEGMVRAGEVERILSAHHAPLAPEAALMSINATRRFLAEVEEATLEAAQGVDFLTLWQSVSRKLNKQPEFRGFAMLQVQVDELIREGRLRSDGGRLSQG